MKRIVLCTGLALALAAPAFAQDVGETPTPETIPETPTDEMENAGAVSTGESEAVYQGPQRSARKTRGRVKGDPPIIDHSADTLIVEPPRSTITIIPPL